MMLNAVMKMAHLHILTLSIQMRMLFLMTTLTMNSQMMEMSSQVAHGKREMERRKRSTMILMIMSTRHSGFTILSLMVCSLFLALSESICHLRSLPGTPCNKDGIDLPPNTPPAPRQLDTTNYAPYTSRAEFELADFLFRQSQLSGKKVNDLMDIWAAHGGDAPFADVKDLHDTIDATPLGDAPWNAFSVSYSGKHPSTGEVPPWMLEEYEVWHRDPRTVIRNQLSNPDFKDEIDYTPVQEFGEDGERRWKDFMSGNWAWSNAVRFQYHSKVPLESKA